MVKSLDFWSVSDLVVDGRVIVETWGGVPAAEGADAAPVGSVVVAMHRELPGCAGVVGHVNREPVLSVCYVDELRRAAFEQRRDSFFFDCGLPPSEAAAAFLVALYELLKGKFSGDEADFHWIVGADGAALLRDLRRIKRAAEAARGVLH